MADTNDPDQSLSSLAALRYIYGTISARRKRQLHLSIVLMLFGAISELVTIAAVLPFLALISDPEAASQEPAVAVALDIVGWQSGDELLVPATLFLVGVAIIAALVRLTLTWVSNKIVLRIGHDLGVQIFSRMLRPDYLFHVQRNTSEVLSGLEKLQIAVFALFLPVMQGAISLVIGLCLVALLFAINPFAAVTAGITVSTVYVLVILLTRQLLVRRSQFTADMQTQRIKLVQEGLGSIRDILIENAQAYFENIFREKDDAYRRAQNIVVFVAAAPRYVVEATGIVVIASLAVYMSSQPGGLVAAIPILGALALGAQRLLPLLQLVYSGWSAFFGYRHVLLDIVKLLSAPVAKTHPRPKDATPLRIRDRFALEGIGFGYGDVKVLSDIWLEVSRGETIGFIGETGSGKSTLLDIIMGLLEPDSGLLTIDGEPLTDANRASWQAQIAHVSQTIYLSDNSIAENIAFGRGSGEIDRERLEYAARRACIHDHIVGLEDGYQTVVGERGVRLSGGQRQRLGIARALYKQAEILILDEATSALDNDTESEVMRNLISASEGLTIFMVAHRLTTLSRCERIVRLSGGRIVEIGRYDEVVGSAGA